MVGYSRIIARQRATLHITISRDPAGQIVNSRRCRGWKPLSTIVSCQEDAGRPSSAVLSCRQDKLGYPAPLKTGETPARGAHAS
jgi:hypothetical protein